MNIKIAKTLLTLSIIYIVGFYIIKFIFPDFLLLQITDPSILHFGEVIQSNGIFTEIYYSASTFLTFYLFKCASSGSFKLNWKELLLIVLSVVANELVAIFMPDLLVHTSTSLMFLIALLCKGKKQYFIPTFIIHGYLSQFLFSIRGFETIIMNTNIATSFMLSIECYAWLLMLSLVFYLKEKSNGKSSTTIPK